MKRLKRTVYLVGTPVILMFFLSTLAFNHLDKFYKNTFYKDLHTLHSFYIALQKDIEMAKTDQSPMVLLRSHTLEQLGHLGLDKLPTFVNFLKKTNRLPTSFKLPVATFGAEDFLTGIARHIGSGKADIDTITYYLGGMNKACWATLGYLVGGAKGADLFKSIGGTAAKLFRERTLSKFKDGILAWRKQGEKVVQDWRSAQEIRLEKGLTAQPITEMFPQDLLRDNGIGAKKIRELNDLAHNFNQKQINMKKDLDIEKVKTYSQQGNVKVGGVDIRSEPVKKGKGGKEQKEEVLESMPSQDSLSWPIKIKKKKKKGGES
jgi:hypothetical protein